MVWKSELQRIRLRFYSFILVYKYQRVFVPIYMMDSWKKNDFSTFWRVFEFPSVPNLRL